MKITNKPKKPNHLKKQFPKKTIETKAPIILLRKDENNSNMERSTTQTNLQQLCGVSSVDHALSDDDLVFIDHHSLKRISLDETEPHIIQTSLRVNLNRRMKEYGRPTLAERILRQEEPIKYKDLTALNLLTSKPRTKQTLLHNITQSFVPHPEKLPNLVSEAMLQKDIRSIPNIFVLHRFMTCQKHDKHSIALIKYLASQCMQIDFNSPFETLEGEYEDCARLLLTPGSNVEEDKQQMCCIKNLEGLHDIWKQQNPADWNQVLLQQTLPTSPGLTEAQEVLKDDAESLTKDSVSLAVALAPEQTDTLPDRSATDQTVESVEKRLEALAVPGIADIL
ncbi:hypothetical protein GCM10023116_34820 [Kistimonas scapharcae]|uniref:Uncharacterized protein n=1 Tax=Kistimonas scapharcae TaxID=1036133 RepID=A0ABP8V6M1_9GAMM